MEKAEDNHYPGRELEAMSFAYNYHKWIVDELAPYFGQNVVEVGAGVGNLSTMLLQTNLNHLYAFEPASNLFPLLGETLTGRSRVTAVNEFFDAKHIPDPIDSILYINVLEHIEDDAAELVKASHALRTGGYLLLFVPALEWLFSKADTELGHFRRYRMSDLLRLVEKTGFTVEKHRHFDVAGILPWYVNFVMLKNSFNLRSVALYDKLVVPPMQVIEKYVNPPIGKNILVIAKKT